MLLKINFKLNILKKRRDRKKRIEWKILKLKLKKEKKIIMLNLQISTSKLFSKYYQYFLTNIYLVNLFFVFQNYATLLLGNFFSHKLRKIKTLRWVKINFILLSPFIKFYKFFDKKYLAENPKTRRFLKQRKKLRNTQYSFIKFFMVNKLFFIKNQREKLLNNAYPLLQRVYSAPRLVTYLMKFWYWRNKNTKISKYWNFFLKKKNYKYHNIFPLLSKNKKNLTGSKYYFFDAHKSPLKALFLARQVHSKFSRKKTLRNVGYKQFLKKSLKQPAHNDYHATKLSHVIRSYKFTYTWYNTFLFIKLGYVFVDGIRQHKDLYFKTFSIFQMPFFTKLQLLRFSIFYKSKKIKKKIKKTKYLNYLRMNKRWMSKKKNTTRLLTWMYANTLNVNKEIIFDFLTGTGVKLPSLSYFYYFDKNMVEGSSLLKLYSWKFRST